MRHARSVLLSPWLEVGDGGASHIFCFATEPKVARAFPFVPSDAKRRKVQEVEADLKAAEDVVGSASRQVPC